MTLELFGLPHKIQALRKNHRQQGVQHTAGTLVKSETAQHLHRSVHCRRELLFWLFFWGGGVPQRYH